MNNRIEAARTELLNKNQELKRLLESGNDLGTADLERAATLQSEVREMKGRFETLRDAGRLADEIAEMGSTPAVAFTMGGTSSRDIETVELDHGRPVTPIKGISREVWSAIASNSYKNAFMTYLGRGHLGLGATDLKTLQIGVDPSGGFLVPEEIQRDLIMKQPTPSNVASRVRRYTTARDSLTIPKIVWNQDDLYQSGVRMTKTGEVPSSPLAMQITDPVFGAARIDVYTHMASGQITRDLVEDGLFDVADILAQQLSVARDVMTDNYILNGNGVGGPSGILANPGGVVGGQQQPAVFRLGSPVAADNVLKLPYTLPPQYDDSAVWIINKTNTEMGIAALKDSQGRYLFAYGMQDNGLASARPKELVGYPILRSQLMPNAYLDPVAGTANANAYAAIFGDLSGYAMIERVGLSIQVLDQTQAKNNQIELVARWRWGGQVVEDWKLKVGQVF